VLTPKERLKCGLKKKSVDRASFICLGGPMNMLVEEVMDLAGYSLSEAHTNPEVMATLAASMYRYGEVDNFGLPLCGTIEAEAMGATVHLETKLFRPEIIAGPIDFIEDWEKLNPLNLRQGRVKVVLDAMRILKNRWPNVVPIIGNLVSPLSLATLLMKSEKVYDDFIRKPKEAHAFMKFLTENLIQFGLGQLKAGADVLAISDFHLKEKNGHPRLFKEYTIPYVNAIIDAVKGFTATGTLIHFSGWSSAEWEELNLLHSDAISYSPAPSAVTGSHKALIGSIPSDFLEQGTPEEIRLVARKLLNQGATVLLPSCGIPIKTPLKNIQSLVETVKLFGPVWS